DPAPFARAIEKLSTYHWVVLTSANGVDALFAELSRTGRDARGFGAARVCAIGPATAARLRARGIDADLVPSEFRGEAVADALLARIGGRETETRVLVPRAEIAREALPRLLLARGVNVDVVASYRAEGPTRETEDAIAQALSERTIDVVTLTSPSSAERLTETLRARSLDATTLLEHVLIASIGPVTSEACAKVGLRVDITAPVYTAEGLVDALADHVTSHGLPR
ncbi:MAG: uroporphyrinogen-III synthase, partial [Deltaproteobacteria bacterium]|nr:uroporphyrinogen-III synthase [Deltaproteobacteria bacterium]